MYPAQYVSLHTPKISSSSSKGLKSKPLTQTDAAGVDTTQEAINRFVVNMMSHPKVQDRAQQEIDTLTGQSRIPGIEE